MSETVIDVDYECGCRYQVPVALTEQQSALAGASAVDTAMLLVDAQHDRECSVEEG